MLLGVVTVFFMLMFIFIDCLVKGRELQLTELKTDIVILYYNVSLF